MPRSADADKEPPRQGEPADAVRAPRLSDAEKEPPRQGEPACGSSSAPLDFTLISYYTEKAKYVVPTTKQEEI